MKIRGVGKAGVLVLVLAWVVLWSAGMWAQAADEKKKEGVEIDLQQFKVLVSPEGKETLGGAETIKPGEMIEYRATYMNMGKEGVKNIQATLPIPLGMEYLSKTAKPAGAKASLDGVKYEAIPLMRKVKLPNGKEVEQEVPYSEYRFLSWNIDELGGEKSAVASARVRLAPLGDVGSGKR